MLRAHIGMGVAYRARLTVWILSSLFPLLMMAVWLSVVDEVGPTAGWRTSDFVSYYAGGALLFHTTTSFLTWTWDADLRSGDMSFKLLKPIDPFHQYLTQEIGLRVVVLSFLLPTLIILTLVVPALTYQLTPLQWVAAVAAAASGFLPQRPDGDGFCHDRFLDDPGRQLVLTLVGDRSFPFGLDSSAFPASQAGGRCRTLPAVPIFDGLSARDHARPANSGRDSHRLCGHSHLDRDFRNALSVGLAAGPSEVSGGGRMNRYLRMLKIFWGNALSTELEYRAAFWANAFLSLFWLAWASLGARAYFRFAESVRGWTYYELLVVMGLFFAINGLRQAIIQPNLSRMAEYIRLGTLDFLLTKPISSQFMVSFRHVGIYNWLDPILGLGLVVFGLVRRGRARQSVRV